MKCYAEKCGNKATHVVEKTADLSHRKARYCELHAIPFEKYPDDFKVKLIKE